MEPLVPQLANPEFRESFLESSITMSVCNQIRAMRGDKSQKEFSEFINKPQSVVSRLESPDAPKSLKSMLDIAHAHKVALLVKFVDYPTYFRLTSLYAAEWFKLEPYNQNAMEALTRPHQPAVITEQQNITTPVHKNTGDTIPSDLTFSITQLSSQASAWQGGQL